VLNLANEARGPREHLDVYEGDAANFGPGVVLVSYYVGNDLTDTMYRDEAKSTLAQQASRLLHKSFFAGYLMELRAGSVTAAQTSELAPDVERLGNLNKALLRAGAVRHPEMFLSNLRMETAAEQAAWRKNERALEEIVARAGRGHARVLIGIFPSCAQVDEQHLQMYRELGFTVTSDLLRESRPQDALNAACSRHGWNCLDMLPAFRAEAAIGRHLYRDDGDHWGAEGNALAFELLKPKLDAMLAAASRAAN
jgi:hypothetical protein